MWHLRRRARATWPETLGEGTCPAAQPHPEPPHDKSQTVRRPAATRAGRAPPRPPGPGWLPCAPPSGAPQPAPTGPGDRARLSRLAGRDGDVLVLLEERAVVPLGDGGHGPHEALAQDAHGLRDVDDDLVVVGLGLGARELEVLAAGVADQARDVEEAEGGAEDLGAVAVAQGQAGVGDQVREAVRAAQEAGLGVLLEARVRLVDRGLEGEGGGRAGLVLRGTRPAGGSIPPLRAPRGGAERNCPPGRKGSPS